MTGRRRLILVTTIVLAVLPLLAEPIQLRRLASLVVLSLAVLGVIVVTGHAGLISLGHGAFVGFGAFTMATFVDNLSIPFLLAVPMTFLLTAAVGWLVGLPALRIKGIYLALVTLGIGIIFPSLAKQFPRATGGVTGRAVDAQFNPPAWTGLDPVRDAVLWRYLFCLLVCALMFWMTANVLQGRMGRAMQALRDDETAAASFGIDLLRVKAGAFGFSAGLAGVAGALQVILFPFVSHDQFSIFLSFRIYAAAVLGGITTVIGAIYGVAALLIVPAVNDALGLLDNDVIVFGLGLILFTFITPREIWARLASRLGRPRWSTVWRNMRERYSG